MKSGIEAEAVMLGQPYTFMHDVGANSTESLHRASLLPILSDNHKILRKEGVVGKFVEFYGPGLNSLSLPDRATISNMAPEYGATLGFFPPDAETLDYLRRTGRSEEQVDLVKKYLEAQDLLYSVYKPEPVYSRTLELDLSTVKPCPQARNAPRISYFLTKYLGASVKLCDRPSPERRNQDLNSPETLLTSAG